MLVNVTKIKTQKWGKTSSKYQKQIEKGKHS